MGKKIEARDSILLCQKEKLAIVATAEPTRGMAPFDDDAYEIWGLSVTATYADVRRMDVIFEMHNEDYFERDPNVKMRLQTIRQPLYMLKQHDDISASMQYPMDLVTTQYRKYHTSSITYMLALALHSFLTTGKPNHVELYGVHMVMKDEYQDQRPCCEYWLGCMETAGMNIVLPAGGGLLSGNGLYGFENYNPVCWDMRQRHFGLTAGLEDAVRKIHEGEIQKAKNEGAIYEMNYWMLKFQRGEY